MHTDTALVHLGRDTAAAANAVNPPLVRTSTVTFAKLRQFQQSYQGLAFDAPRYGRSGTSTTFELQRAMAKLCGAQTCLATASGLAALVAVLSAHAGPERHLLVSEGIYGPARAFCEEILRGAGCDVEFFPAQTDIGVLLRDNTSLVLIETPASLTMEMLDVRAICAAAHTRRVPVAADSTWGTPLFFDAHRLGVDISIHAATKYIGGHSDLMLGLITGSLAALATTRAYCDRSGAHAAPDVCWLALRGLRTLGVRMRRHQESAMSLALWLQFHPAVRRVLFPALPSDPGHALWREQFSGAAGPFTFELKRCDEAQFERFIDALRLFALGTSWGGFESLVMPALPHRLRAQTGLPDDGRLVRIHVGLEDARDLRDDLAQAFEKAAIPPPQHK